ncbi:hypothetical protein G9A89_021055 [Geosiphon pyriformis]|nr:hypothetical protein G9A89_021055 [Geosiphon pyriformis]
MAAGFTSKQTADLCTYFMKALHCRLPVAIHKCLYDRSYPNVVCLYCGCVEVLDHVFSCDFDFASRGRLFVRVALCKDFVFNDWFFEAVSVFGDLKLAGVKIVDFVHDFCLAFRDEIWLVCVKHHAFIKKHGVNQVRKLVTFDEKGNEKFLVNSDFKEDNQKETTELLTDILTDKTKSTEKQETTEGTRVVALA